MARRLEVPLPAAGTSRPRPLTPAPPDLPPPLSVGGWGHPSPAGRSSEEGATSLSCLWGPRSRLCAATLALCFLQHLRILRLCPTRVRESPGPSSTAPSSRSPSLLPVSWIQPRPAPVSAAHLCPLPTQLPVGLSRTFLRLPPHCPQAHSSLPVPRMLPTGLCPAEQPCPARLSPALLGGSGRSLARLTVLSAAA